MEGVVRSGVETTIPVRMLPEILGLAIQQCSLELLSQEGLTSATPTIGLGSITGGGSTGGSHLAEARWGRYIYTLETVCWETWTGLEVES